MSVPANRVAAVILAAGSGSRLGGGKLLLPWRGKPLLVHVIETAAACVDTIVVVVGCRADMAREAIGRSGGAVRIVENSRWEEGQSTSLQCGMAAVVTPDITGVLVMLGDQPLVRPDTLAALIEAHPGHPATVPVYGGRRGNPVILSPALAGDIAALRGDVGARHILARHGDRVRRVAVDDPGILRDIDTLDDYRDLGS